MPGVRGVPLSKFPTPNGYLNWSTCWSPLCILIEKCKSCTQFFYFYLIFCFQLLISACGHRMAHRKWKETKLQPSMLPGPAVPGYSLVFSISCGPFYVGRLYTHSSCISSWYMLQCIIFNQFLMFSMYVIFLSMLHNIFGSSSPTQHKYIQELCWHRPRFMVFNHLGVRPLQ